MGLITQEGYIINKPEEYLRKKELYKKALENQISKKQNIVLDSQVVFVNQNPY